MIINKKQITIYLAVAFFSAVFFIPDFSLAVTCDSNIEGKSDQELQAILEQCDKDIAAQQEILKNNQKEQVSLKQGIAEITANIEKTQLEINAKKAKIKQLGDNIVVKSQYIVELSERMEEIKKSIAKMIRETYAEGDNTVIDVLLSSESLSSFFVNSDNYASISSKLQDLILELSDVKTVSQTEKKALESKKVQEEKLKYEQESAKKLYEVFKAERQKILAVTKGKESEYKKFIADKEKLKNQIRNKLYKTAGGVEISFGDALKLIQPYESAIGVDSALILAVLFQESSADNLIGRNIGKCTYNQPSNCVTGKTVMSDTQKPYYLEIMSKLELNADKSPVSCAICRDGNYGGAMGPAQFMPETWSGIAKKISSILGISYPSPFNNLDAFVAAGVLLKDNQDRCKTAFTKTSQIWSCAASKYYGGLNLKGSRLTNYMNYGYGASVLKRALEFAEYIDTLNS